MTIAEGITKLLSKITWVTDLKLLSGLAKAALARLSSA